MKTVNFLKLAATALCFVATAASAGNISGSSHDFTASGWGTTELCLACHAAHNNTNGPATLLWNHDMSEVTDYTVYTSPTFSGAPGAQPDGSSMLCLSCHDGTVALDSFGGGNDPSSSGAITGDALVGTDLSNDHPISFTYTTESGLHDPTVKTVTIGEGADAITGLLGDTMLYGGTVQCSSCHDVHNTNAIAGTPLLLIANTGSALCLTCHDK